MSLIPWKKQEPVAFTPSPLFDLQQDMNRLFGRFFGDMGATFGSIGMFPPVSVRENEKVITVTAEVPGMTANEVEVTVDGNILTMHGEKKDEKREDKDRWHRVERSYGSFSRRIELPAAVDAAHAEATLEKGVLTLKLPKTTTDQMKTIKVQAK